MKEQRASQTRSANCERCKQRIRTTVAPPNECPVKVTSCSHSAFGRPPVLHQLSQKALSSERVSNEWFHGPSIVCTQSRDAPASLCTRRLKYVCAMYISRRRKRSWSSRRAKRDLSASPSHLATVEIQLLHRKQRTHITSSGFRYILESVGWSPLVPGDDVRAKTKGPEPSRCSIASTTLPCPARREQKWL